MVEIGQTSHEVDSQVVLSRKRHFLSPVCLCFWLRIRYTKWQLRNTYHTYFDLAFNVWWISCTLSAMSFISEDLPRKQMDKEQRSETFQICKQFSEDMCYGLINLRGREWVVLESREGRHRSIVLRSRKIIVLPLSHSHCWAEAQLRPTCFRDSFSRHDCSPNWTKQQPSWEHELREKVIWWWGTISLLIKKLNSGHTKSFFHETIFFSIALKYCNSIRRRSFLFLDLLVIVVPLGLSIYIVFLEGQLGSDFFLFLGQLFLRVIQLKSAFVSKT